MRVARPITLNEEQQSQLQTYARGRRVPKRLVAPTSASWLNMVERFFRDITQNQIRRGAFHSDPELVAAIEAYATQHNRDPKPFIWTAKASDILEKVTRARRSLDKAQSE